MRLSMISTTSHTCPSYLLKIEVEAKKIECFSRLNCIGEKSSTKGQLVGKISGATFRIKSTQWLRPIWKMGRNNLNRIWTRVGPRRRRREDRLRWKWRRGHFWIKNSSVLGCETREKLLMNDLFFYEQVRYHQSWPSSCLRFYNCITLKIPLFGAVPILCAVWHFRPLPYPVPILTLECPAQQVLRGSFWDNRWSYWAYRFLRTIQRGLGWGGRWHLFFRGIFWTLTFCFRLSEW